MKKKKQPELSDNPKHILNSGMSDRSRHTLRRQGIEVVDDLNNFAEEELLKRTQIGPRVIAEAKVWALRHNVHLDRWENLAELPHVCQITITWSDGKRVMVKRSAGQDMESFWLHAQEQAREDAPLQAQSTNQSS